MRYLLIATFCLCSSVYANEKTAEEYLQEYREREAAEKLEKGKEIFKNFSNYLFSGVKPNQDNAQMPNQGGAQMPNQGDAQMPVGPPQLFTSLTAEQARYGVALYFQQRQQNLDLSGLTSIDVDVARELAKFRPTRSSSGGFEYCGCLGSLNLNGLTSITPEVARELGKLRATLNLNGLTSITPEAARELSKLGTDPANGNPYRQSKSDPGACYKICLLGLNPITPEVARELVRTRAELSLRMQNIDIDIAEQLMRYEGNLLWIQVNVRSLSPGVMAYLERNKVIKVVNTANQLENLATRESETIWIRYYCPKCMSAETGNFKNGPKNL